MATLQEAIEEFLAQKPIAVAGVSRDSSQAANTIYKKLRTAGYKVVPINPKAEEVEGDRCYPDLKSVPGGVQAVFMATHPKVTELLVHDCADLGINHVWIHRSFGQGSLSEAAVTFAREKGIKIIPGGCPMMFVPPVDFGHVCIRFITGLTGSLPKQV